MPRHAVSRTANVERTGRHKWVKVEFSKNTSVKEFSLQVIRNGFPWYWKAKLLMRKQYRMYIHTFNVQIYPISMYTQKNLFEILLIQTEIRLYLSFSDWYGTRRTSVWLQINRKMVNTIWFPFDLIRCRKVFSVCKLNELWSCFQWTIKLVSS